jgi:hypothetical protein
MKHASNKKKTQKIREDAESAPPVKRTAGEFDTAYFVSEAALDELTEKPSPQPAPQPLAPEPPPANKPLTPLAALWPDVPPAPAPAHPVGTPAALPPKAAPKGAPAPVPSLSPKVKVTFALRQRDAKSVALSGEFNGWSPDGLPLRRREDGQWETSLELAPGRYQYKFIVDGEWIADPLAQELVFNPHGTSNSVIEVRG